MGDYDTKIRQMLQNDSEPESRNLVNARVRHRVEVQSLQIDRFLSRHNIQAKVEGGEIRNDWIDFNIRSQLSEGWQRLGKFSADLIDALGVPDVRFVREKGNLRLLVKKESNHPVDLLDLYTSKVEIRVGEVILGIDDGGRPVILDLFGENMSHVLVAGQEGAGKSSLLRTIATSLALSSKQSEIQLCILSAGNSPSGLFSEASPLLPLNYLPHLQFPVTHDVEEAAEVLQFLADEIAYREEIELDTPKLVVLIDDADLLIESGGQRIVKSILDLLEATETTGLRLIISTTDPNHDPISQMVSYDAQLRLVGLVTNEDEAFLLTGEEESGAEYLNGRGDFYAISYGQFIRFQAAFIDDYDLHLTINEIYRLKRKILIARQKKDGKPESANHVKEESVSFSLNKDGGGIRFRSDPEISSEVIEGTLIYTKQGDDTNQESLNNAKEARTTALSLQESRADVLDQDTKLPSKRIDKFEQEAIAQSKNNSGKSRSRESVNNTTSERPKPQSDRTMTNDEALEDPIPFELEYSDFDDEEWIEDGDQEIDQKRYH